MLNSSKTVPNKWQVFLYLSVGIDFGRGAPPTDEYRVKYVTRFN